MNFSDHIAGLDEAVFEHLGDPAQWAGIEGLVRIIYQQGDEIVSFGTQAQTVLEKRLVHVRKSEVADPRAGDRARPGRQTSGGEFIAGLVTIVVVGEPTLDQFGSVWLCEVTEDP